jgi:hypothetical protein
MLEKGSLGRLNVVVEQIIDVHTEAQRWLVILRMWSDSYYAG